jgi:hypothetical protein
MLQVRDLVLKPLEGLSHDAPGGFLGGLNSGATSFIENVSHGAFGSISGFASSVAHNVPAPVGGAIGLFAKTGRSFMRSVGLTEEIVNLAAPVDRDGNSRSRPTFIRFRLKVLPPRTQLFASLECTGISRSGITVARTLLLTDTAIHV